MPYAAVPRCLSRLRCCRLDLFPPECTAVAFDPHSAAGMVPRVDAVRHLRQLARMDAGRMYGAETVCVGAAVYEHGPYEHGLWWRVCIRRLCV